MEEYRLTWIEEPFWPDEYDKYRALAEAIDTPIAAGEEETTIWDFERLIDRSGVQIVQPDVTRAGGIRECLRDRLARSANRAEALRAARLEHRHHQGGEAARARRHGRGRVLGVLRPDHRAQPAPRP